MSELSKFLIFARPEPREGPRKIIKKKDTLKGREGEVVRERSGEKGVDNKEMKSGVIIIDETPFLFLKKHRKQ
jgi:hypothetical protein